MSLLHEPSLVRMLQGILQSPSGTLTVSAEVKHLEEEDAVEIDVDMTHHSLRGDVIVHLQYSERIEGHPGQNGPNMSLSSNELDITSFTAFANAVSDTLQSSCATQRHLIACLKTIRRYFLHFVSSSDQGHEVQISVSPEARNLYVDRTDRNPDSGSTRALRVFISVELPEQASDMARAA